MATIIDSLLIQFGFDTSGLSKGGRDAGRAMSGVKNGANKTGASLDKMGKDGAQAIHSLAREAVAFFAVFTAGKSLKAFIEDNTTANVALQNLARNLGTTTQTLGAWQNVAESFGGAGSDVSGSMQSLVSQFQTVEGRQNLGRVFGQMGVQLMDANGHLRTMTQLIPDLATAAQRLGPQLFSALGAQAGFSQGFINMLEQNPQRLIAMYQALQQYAPTAQDAAASQELLEDWVKLTAQSEAFGRSIMTSLTPELDELMRYISGLIDKNQGWLRQDIDQYAKKIGDAIEHIDWKSVGATINAFFQAIQNIDWNKIEADIQAFVTGADDASKAIGGWQNALELLFGLWVGSKFVAVMANVLALGRAAGLSSAAVTALLGSTAGVATVAPLALSGDTNDNEPPTPAFVKYQLNEAFTSWQEREKNPRLRQPGVAYKAGSILQQLGITQDQWSAYSGAVAGIEGADYNQMGGAGNSYAGRYQMSQTAIREAAAYLHEPTPTLAQFLNDPQMQERFFEAYTALNAKALSKNSYFQGANADQKLDILGYAWNQGAGGADNWLNTGVPGSDAFGTSGLVYAKNVQAALNEQQPPQNNDSVSDALNAVRTRLDGAGNTSSTTTITAPITIYAPGGDPKKISNALDNYFNEQLTKARQANSGVQ